MHPYATDSNERKQVAFLLVIISVLVAWFLHKRFEVLKFTIPWWVDLPSVAGFYAIFYNIFNKYTWRLPILKRIGLVRVPNLNGTWRGYITSSFNEHAKREDANIEICQSWSSISINMRTKNSKSRSLTAWVLTKNKNAITISYEYLNEPMPNAKVTMHAHRGTVRLTIKPDNKTFEGEYYTGRDRQNFGILSFKRT